MDNVSLQHIFNRITLFKYRYRGSVPSDCVPTLGNDHFALIITHSSNMQGEHWIIIANSCHKVYFADSLGRPSFSQAAVRTDDERTTTISSQRLRFLRDKFSFPSPKFPTRRKYWSSRSYCVFSYK